MNVLIINSVMLALLLGLSTLIFIKIRSFSKVNLFIFISLVLFWIGLHLMLSTSGAMDKGAYWKWPILIGSYQLTQACVRLPLGKFAQKIKSRKIPIMTAVFILILFSIPLFIQVNFVSILFATIAAGVFGATYGMQNQHWAERWRMKHMYVTIAILVIVFSVGKYVSQIALWDTKISESSVRWIVIAAVSVMITGSLIYAFTVPRDPSKVATNNMTSYAEKVSDMKMWDAIKYTFTIFFVGYIASAINDPLLVGVSGDDYKLVTSIVLAVSILSTMLLAFFIVRFVKGINTLYFSYALMLAGLLLIMIKLFTNSSSIVSITGFALASLGTNICIMTSFGQAFYTDNVTPMLTLGIWLSFKSLALSLGTISVKQISHYDPDGMKWFAMSLLIILSVSLAAFILHQKRDIFIFKMVDNFERKDNRFTEKMKRMKWHKKPKGNKH